MKKLFLKNILFKYFNTDNFPNIYINDIKIDSRLVKKNDLFIAVKGYKDDGKNYIYNALLNGAISVLTYSNINKNYYLFSLKYNIFVFFIYNLNNFLSEIAGNFYGNPSKKMFLFGVTGTNGKTTVVNFISNWIYLLGYKSSLLSTLGNGLYNNLHYSLNTTSSAVDTQCELKNQYNMGSKFSCVEVSSHSLIQDRVKSLYFNCAIFTNLSLDHLDYHKNFRNYELAKRKLFFDFNIKNLIINIDDNIGFKWFKELQHEYVIPVTFNKSNFIYFKYKWLYIKKVVFFGFLKKIYFESYLGNGILNFFFPGNFNIINVMLSFISLLSSNFNFNNLLDTSKYLSLPKGRMEFFFCKKKPLFIVDFAHTPDALKNVLIECRKYCLGKLWCVFGCTGNRDKSKRSLMGFIAKNYSDIVIITNDDLYSEDENSILEDIKLGIKNFDNVYIILNRILAIKFSFINSNYNDVILVAGKGHENFHILSDRKIKYSDRYLIRKILG